MPTKQLRVTFATINEDVKLTASRFVWYGVRCLRWRQETRICNEMGRAHDFGMVM